MNETWKARGRFAFRAVELLLAFALLAVLIELVLVLVNSPGPVPEIRFIRVPTPPPEASLPNGLKPVEAPMPAAPELAAVPPKPVERSRPAVRPPAPPAPPALLDFTNLRRVLGGGGGSSGGGGGGQVSVTSEPGPSPMIVINPSIPVTNAPPAKTNPPVSGTPPSTPTPTNAEPPAVSNTPTNSPRGETTRPETTNTFRISVP